MDRMEEQPQPEVQKILVGEGATRVEVPLPQPLDPTPNTRVYVDASLKSLRSEMRVWFISAIVGQQLLAHIQLGTAVAYIGGTAMVALAMSAKALSSLR